MNNRYLLFVIFTFLSISVVFSQDAQFNWAKQYGSLTQANYLTSLTSDNVNLVFAYSDFEDEITIDGNIYLSQGGSDLIIFALDENGETIWQKTEGGPNDEIAQDIQCDSEGNVYITGKFNNTLNINGVSFESNGSWDMFLAKYSNNGEFLWCKVFGGPNSEALISMKIKFDRVVLAGRFYNFTCIDNDTIFSQDGTDVFLAKFNLDGELINTLDIGGQGVDMISDLSIDSQGNIYIVGDFYQDIHFGETTFEAGDALGVYMAKYNPSFQLLWAYQMQGDDLKPGVKLSVSSSGDISVAGNFSSTVQFGNNHLTTADFDEDIYLASFTSGGEVNWAQRFYSNSMETLIGMSVDKYGDTYISGHYLDHIHFGELTIHYNLCCGEPEIFMVKIDFDGNITNSLQITGERSGIQTMVVPEVNQIYLGGYFSDQIAFGDIILNSPTSYNIFITNIKDDTWLANSSSSKDEFTIFPNPFTRNFQLNRVEGYHYFRVLNENGKIIVQQNFLDKKIAIGENWSTGIYLIQLFNAEGQYISQKVIKL